MGIRLGLHGARLASRRTVWTAGEDSEAQRDKEVFELQAPGTDFGICWKTVEQDIATLSGQELVVIGYGCGRQLLRCRRDNRFRIQTRERMETAANGPVRFRDFSREH
jgi:hypothetical protein